MVENLNHRALQEQHAHKVKISDVPPVSALGQGDEENVFEPRWPVITNDFHVAYTTAEPGDIIPWHTHAPSLYQVILNIGKGRAVWYYENNEGNEKSIELGPDEAMYFPSGAVNKVEVVGDKPHTHISVYPKRPLWRVEQLISDPDEEGIYEPKDVGDPDGPAPVGLWYDNVRDEIVSKHPDAYLG